MTAKLKPLILILMLALMGCTANGKTQAVLFLKSGKKINEPTLSNLKNKVSPTYVEVHDPHIKNPITYQGFDFRALLKAIYGPSILEATELEILFTCLDGYQASVPMAKFSESNAYLVYEIKGKDDFSFSNTLQGEEYVPLGPYYLVWKNEHAWQLRADSAYYWPYQVTGVDLILPSERYPHMVPPEGSSPQVVEGYHNFRLYCQTCHQINGDGGKKSIDLNHPQNITERLSDDVLMEWMLNPRAINPETTMPALYQKLGEENRTKTAASILAYLKAMKSTQL